MPPIQPIQLVTEEVQPNARRRFALIIGISEYAPNSLFNNLNLTAKDAKDLHDVLSTQAGYEKVKLLLDRQATRHGILKALDELFEQIRPQDIFLFYFSGHGARDSSGQSYLVPQDVYDSNNDLTRSSLDGSRNLLNMQEDILTLLYEQQIHAMVMIVDACHSNNVPQDGFAFPLSIPENVAGMAAARPGEFAYEIKELNNGVFTHFLLKGLEGEADLEKKGIVTIFDLHRYVSRRVRDYTQDKGSLKQTPILNYVGSEDIVIGTYPKAQAELDAERKEKKVGKLFKELESHSQEEEWEKILADWNQLLLLGWNAHQKFPDALLRARQELDKDNEPFEKEKIEDIKTYPRIWPCRKNKHIGTGYAIFLTHPDVHKGDILIECETKQDQTTVLTNVKLAEIDGVPITDQEQKIHYYVTAKTIVGLDSPPLPLSRLARVRNQKMKNLVQKWDNFEKWTQDLRAIEVWDKLRQVIFKERPKGIANPLLEAEFKPLEYGLKNYPDTQGLHEAANQLLHSYKTWVRPGTIQDLKSRISQIKPNSTTDRPSATLTDGQPPIDPTRFQATVPSTPEISPDTSTDFEAESGSKKISDQSENRQDTPPQVTVKPATTQLETATVPSTPEISPDTSTDSRDQLSKKLWEDLSKLLGRSVQAGERLDLGASKIISQPPDELSSATRSVWQQTILPAIKSNARVENTHTLNIHLSSSFRNLESQFVRAENSTEESKTSAEESKTSAEESKTSAEESKYRAILTLKEEIDGQLQERRTEGILKLNLKNLSKTPFGSSAYGAVLHHALFHDEEPENSERVLYDFTGRHTLIRIYIMALARSADIDSILRLQLQINTDVTELHDLPWEYLWDDANPAIGSLACWERTPFARVLHVSSSTDIEHPPIISSNSPMRVLTVLSSPPELKKEQVKDEDMKGLAPIPLREIEVLKENLSKVGQLLEPPEEESLLASPHERVCLETIRQRLQQAKDLERPFHVLHMLCHGTILKVSGEASLLLQQENSDEAEWVTDRIFADLLLEFPELRLVVLASCLTALQTKNNSLNGIARQLVDKGIPAVIAMQESLDFRSAQHFSCRLYTQLAYHGEIDRAVNAARRELYTRVKRSSRPMDPEVVPPREWGYPVLFMRLSDGKLFQIEKGDTACDPDAPVEILPFEEQSNQATQELEEGLLKTLVRQYSFLNSDGHLSNLLRAMQKTLVDTYQDNPPNIPSAPVSMTKQLPLFGQPGEEKQRWALVQSVGVYRRHSTRRLALYLRALAQSKMSQLANQSQIETLTLQDYRNKIWSCGYVKFSDRHVTNLWSELAEIPISDSLFNVEVQGNLTWIDSERNPPTNLDTTVLKALLCEHSKVVFQTFSKLIQPENYPSTGLDEHTISLLLHTIHPDVFISNSHFEEEYNLSSLVYIENLLDFCF